MSNRETTNFTIFSQHLAGYLMMRGFVLIGMDRKKNCADNRNVYFFNNSEELQNAIKEYKKLK